MNRLLLFFSAFFITFCLFSQISLNIDTVYIVGHVGQEDVAHSLVKNDSDVTLTLKWRRIVNDLKSGTSAICDVNACYSDETDFTTFSLNSSQEGTMDAHFKPTAYYTDTSIVQIAIFNPDDSINTVIVGTYKSYLSPISSSFASFPVVHPINDDTATSSATVYNYGSDTVYLSWKLDTLNPIIGNAILCINGICSDVNTPSSDQSPELAPGDSLQVDVKFILNGSVGQGYATIDFYDIADTNNINVTTTFYAQAKFGTAVNELSNDNSYLLYPNPAKDILTLEGAQEAKFIEIYDLLGSQVTTQSLTTNFSKQVINVSNLNEGLYFIKLLDSSNNIIGVSRFTKTL